MRLRLVIVCAEVRGRVRVRAVRVRLRLVVVCAEARPTHPSLLSLLKPQP